MNRLNAILQRQLGPVAVLAVQNPIRVDDYSEPQPDYAVPREIQCIRRGDQWVSESVSGLTLTANEILG